MVSSSKDSSRPPAENPAPSGVLNQTTGGAPPDWQSILPTGGGSATLADQPYFSSAATTSSTPPGATAAGGSTSASGSSSATAEALSKLSPAARQAYDAAIAAGDNVEAARILLSAQMTSSRQAPSDQRQFGSSFGGAASGRAGFGSHGSFGKAARASGGHLY